MTVVVALAIVALVGLLVLEQRRHDAALATERARSHELYQLLEAKAAPQQFYSLAPEPDPDSELALVYDDTGLIARYVPREDL